MTVQIGELKHLIIDEQQHTVLRCQQCSKASTGERSTWRFLDLGDEPIKLTHFPRLRMDDLFTLRSEALFGIGAVLVPRLIVAKDLVRGALIRLLPSLRTGSMHAIFPSRIWLLWGFDPIAGDVC